MTSLLRDVHPHSQSQLKEKSTNSERSGKKL